MKPGLTSEQQLQEMLKLKLMSGEEVTWGDAVIALFGAGEGDLAQKIAGDQNHGLHYINHYTKLSYICP